MKLVLVQACCGPCACAPIKDALAGFSSGECELSLFFNGDNFDTKAEYERRLGALEFVNQKLFGGREIIIEACSPQVFPDCDSCVRWRLTRCAQAAAKSGLDAWTTTLTVSPHKNTAEINRIGAEVAALVGVPFLSLDLKKKGGFNKSVLVSKSFGIYRQNYCGCARSVRK
jgi:predicted adenine nucleotide alpha hydrolase (AANH) superfamily ATPase